MPVGIEERTREECERLRHVVVLFFVPTSAFVFPRGVGRAALLSLCDAAGNGNGTRLFSGYSRRESYNRSGL